MGRRGRKQESSEEGGDEPEGKRLRRSCDRCTDKKVKCDGLAQCTNCVKRGYACHYSSKKRTGPRIKTVFDENPALAAAYLNGAGSEGRLVPWLGDQSRTASPPAQAPFPSTPFNPEVGAGLPPGVGVAPPFGGAGFFVGWGADFPGPQGPPQAGAVLTASPFGPMPPMSRPPLARLIRKEEGAYLETFLRDFNAFCPVTRESMIRQALANVLSGHQPVIVRPRTDSSASAFSSSSTSSTSSSTWTSSTPVAPDLHPKAEDLEALNHEQDQSALSSILWASIAVGCLMSGETTAAASIYSTLAWSSIKDCFDRASATTVSAYLIMSILFEFYQDKTRHRRYLRLAEQLLEESTENEMEEHEELSAALMSMKVMDCRATADICESMYQLIMAQDPNRGPASPAVRCMRLSTRAVAHVAYVQSENKRRGVYGLPPLEMEMGMLISLLDVSISCFTGGWRPGYGNKLPPSTPGHLVVALFGPRGLLMAMSGRPIQEALAYLEPFLEVLERLPGLARLEQGLHYAHSYGMLTHAIGDLASYHRLRDIWRRMQREVNWPGWEVVETPPEVAVNQDDSDVHLCTSDICLKVRAALMVPQGQRAAVAGTFCPVYTGGKLPSGLGGMDSAGVSPVVGAQTQAHQIPGQAPTPPLSSSSSSISTPMSVPSVPSVPSSPFMGCCSEGDVSDALLFEELGPDLFGDGSIDLLSPPTPTHTSTSTHTQLQAADCHGAPGGAAAEV